MMKISKEAVSIVKAELSCIHSLAIINQKDLQDIKLELLKERSNQVRRAGTTILTSLILSILFIALVGVVVLPLCLTGHLAALTLALGNQQVVVAALVACSIVFLVCLASVICLFINSNENKVLTK